jgi:hypothetical protein
MALRFGALIRRAAYSTIITPQAWQLAFWGTTGRCDEGD